MAIYEAIPTIKLSKRNQIIKTGTLPELVHFNDPAKSVFIDFKRIKPAIINRQTPIDLAIQETKFREVSMLLVVHHDSIIGLISQKEMISEHPLRLMQEKGLHRTEITVELLMKPLREIVAVEANTLKHAQVGHIITTMKEHNTPYILVIKKLSTNNQVITGLFSAYEIGKQLHMDLYSSFGNEPETIIELHRERRR